MRMLPIALCVTLLLLVSFAAQAPVVGEAAAQTQTKAQPQSKEASSGPRYRVLPYTAGSWIYHCVANGGRVD